MAIPSRRSKRVKVLLGSVTALIAMAASALLGASIATAASSMTASETYHYVGLKTETTQSSYTSASWVDVPGSNITVQATASSALFARFGGQSICEGSGGWCSVRIMVTCPGNWSGFKEMNPADGSNFVWQWSGSGWESIMIERAIQCVKPKQSSSLHFFNMKAQVFVNGATRLRLQDWTLHAGIIAGAGFLPQPI